MLSVSLNKTFPSFLRIVFNYHVSIRYNDSFSFFFLFQKCLFVLLFCCFVVFVWFFVVGFLVFIDIVLFWFFNKK